MYWSRLKNKFSSSLIHLQWDLQWRYIVSRFYFYKWFSNIVPWVRRSCHTWYHRLSRTLFHISPPRSSDSPSAQHCRISTHTETQQIRQSETAYCALSIVDSVCGKTFLGVVHCLALLVIDRGVLGLVLHLALLLRDRLVLSPRERFKLWIIQTPGGDLTNQRLRRFYSNTMMIMMETSCHHCKKY